MGSEQFSLKWNNHTSHLVGVFGTLLQSESLVDVTLSCEGRSLRAHKLVLSACSPYFKALFQDHAEPHPIVILKDVKFSELRTIIQFMYNGEVEIEKNDLDSLFSTAEGLMIRGLAGSRPSFAVSSLRETSAPPPPPETDPRKRAAPEPCDSGGEGAAREGEGAPPSPVRAPSPAARLSNGGESDCPAKRLKPTPAPEPEPEPESPDEASSDPIDAAGTTYLCPECGLSFYTQQQLQLHHSAAHASPSAAPERAPVWSRVRRPVSGDPSAPAGGGGSGPAPAAAHCHSWPPQEGAGARLWEPPLRYLPGGRFLPPPLLPDNTVLAGMIAGLRPLVPEPLNLSGDGAPVSPPPETEPSAPSTPTPADAETLLTCKVCTRVFETPAALREHAAVHQGERPFRCHWCGKAFKFRHHLKDHCRIHTGERPFDCKVCGKTFARSSILKTHAKTHRVEERRFESTASPLLPPGAGGATSMLEGALPALALPALPAPTVSVKEEASPGP